MQNPLTGQTMIILTFHMEIDIHKYKEVWRANRFRKCLYLLLDLHYILLLYSHNKSTEYKIYCSGSC